MMEIWRDIKGYEGFYKISNAGRVMALNRTTVDKRGHKHTYHERILKPQENSSGYLRVNLKKDGSGENLFVHRIVALHFVENSDPKINTIVNHLDADYLNNTASNLEWTTMKGNSQHALKLGRMNRTPQWIEHLKKGLEHTIKPVEAYNPRTGEVVARYQMLSDVEHDGFLPSCVCSCCKGKRFTHKGKGWRYAESSK